MDVQLVLLPININSAPEHSLPQVPNHISLVIQIHPPLFPRHVHFVKAALHHGVLCALHAQQHGWKPHWQWLQVACLGVEQTHTVYCGLSLEPSSEGLLSRVKLLIDVPQANLVHGRVHIWDFLTLLT